MQPPEERGSLQRAACCPGGGSPGFWVLRGDGDPPLTQGLAGGAPGFGAGMERGGKATKRGLWLCPVVSVPSQQLRPRLSITITQVLSQTQERNFVLCELQSPLYDSTNKRRSV